MVETAFKILVIAMFVGILVSVIGTVSFGWTLSTSPYLQGLTSFLAVIFYILPIGKLSPIIFCFIASMVFRVAVAIIHQLWDILDMFK